MIYNKNKAFYAVDHKLRYNRAKNTEDDAKKPSLSPFLMKSMSEDVQGTADLITNHFDHDDPRKLVTHDKFVEHFPH